MQSALCCDVMLCLADSDISMQVDVRADTLNNIIYDPDSEEYMIYTRLDCGAPPFADNPALKGCTTDGAGLRRAGRSVSKVPRQP